MIRQLAPEALPPVVALLACLGGACGGGGGSAVDSGAVTCEPNTFRLVGAIDDMSIDVTQPSEGSGFSQLGTGDFVTITVPDALPSSYTDLHVMWSTLIPDGQTAPATATLKIPTSPFPDDAFCAGQGSTIHISDEINSAYSFHLTSLTSGAGCATPRRGTLEACSRFAN